MNSAIEINAEGRSRNPQQDLNMGKPREPRAGIIAISPFSLFAPVQEVFADKAGFSASAVHKILWLGMLCAFWRLFPRLPVKPGRTQSNPVAPVAPVKPVNPLQTH
jgi:hypothetical protein